LGDAIRIVLPVGCPRCLATGRGSTPHQEGGFVVRRTVLLLAAMAMALSVSAGVALAVGDSGPGVTKTCRTPCKGTANPDTLKGTKASNHIEGLGANESATEGDLIQGFAGNDVLHGDAGGDRIEGGNDNDSIFGDTGEDLLIGGSGNDHINGGSGGDIIRVKDGQRDVVNCEGGNDNVQNRDRIDVLRNC
jgi:Ca2+-binding RTX toxin-like protein